MEFAGLVSGLYSSQSALTVILSEAKDLEAPI